MINIPSNIINGQAVKGAEAPFSVIDPATGEGFAECSATSTAQLDEAVAAAAEAFKTWQHTPDAELKAMAERTKAAVDQIKQKQ